MKNGEYNAREYRENIGADILEMIEHNGEFPISDVHKLTKRMMSYYKYEGFQKKLKEDGYKDIINQKYWKDKLSDIKKLMRKERNKYFDFVRNGKGFEGNWKFVNKDEYNAVLEWECLSDGTRVNNYNDKLEDGNKKWKLNLPRFDDPPLLENK